ncbi:MAG: branched-chain amino acid aminotransferase [Alphaproteobacteria bacterium]|nr:branched-chain amino acid aminotransferase [Alphaproteobacteria bacterium]
MTPFDRRDGWIWKDGALVPWRACQAHVLTHGLHYASAVIEGERAYDGCVFRLREHGGRLAQSAEIMNMDLPFGPRLLDDAVLETLDANGLREAYIRRIAWRGSEQLGVSAPDNAVHVAIACWPWTHYFAGDAQERGLCLTWGRYRRPSPKTAPCHAKATGLYMINTLSKELAEADGFDDALMLDWRGFVAEATGANVFFVRDGALYTPPPECFLDGITRRTVMALARERGVPVYERYILPVDIDGFEGCFLTGTAAEVTPVTALDEHIFGIPPLVRALMQDYRDLVRAPGAELDRALRRASAAEQPVVPLDRVSSA